MRRSLFFSSLVSLLAVPFALACGRTPLLLLPADDSGGDVDAGVGVAEDAGGSSDAGVVSDAGASEDATSEDATPVTIPQDAGPITYAILASGQALPSGIAVDDAGVYWIDLGVPLGHGKSAYGFDGGALMTCAKGGCPGGPTTLASGLTQELFVGDPAPIVVEDGLIYFGAVDAQSFAGELLTCSTHGCGGAPRLFASANVWALATNGASLFWTSGSQEDVGSCPLAGCDAGPTSIFTPDGGLSGLSYGIAADQAGVYWLLTGGGEDLVSCAVAGCGNVPTSLGSTLAQYAQMTERAGNLYFTYPDPDALGGIMTCPTSGCPGGTPIAIAPNRSSPIGIAVDEENVYWTELGEYEVGGVFLTDAGGVYACPRTGCAGAPIALATGLNEPEGIAVDETTVYFTDVLADGGGIVASVLKPGVDAGSATDGGSAAEAGASDAGFDSGG